MKKNKTRTEYLRRIGLALDYIEQHLDQPIRLDEVASASYFSAYHFHRIFNGIVGETVNDYISRKRMERAIRTLLYKPDMNITDVASSGGFSSSANFAKAFRLYFGVSPSEIRSYQPADTAEDEKSKIGKLYRKYGKVFKPEDLYSQLVTRNRVFEPDQLKELLMKIKVEDLPEKNIAYLSSPKGYVLDSVYATWDKVSQWADQHGIDNGLQNKFAICHDNPVITPEEKCRYDAAIVIAPDTVVAEPFTRGSIPGGKYAIAYYKDSAEKISNFMTEFCSQWMASSGYEPDDYPSVFNYLNDSKNDDVVEMNVYLKLKDLVQV